MRSEFDIVREFTHKLGLPKEQMERFLFIREARENLQSQMVIIFTKALLLF